MVALTHAEAPSSTSTSHEFDLVRPDGQSTDQETCQWTATALTPGNWAHTAGSKNQWHSDWTQVHGAEEHFGGCSGHGSCGFDSEEQQPHTVYFLGNVTKKEPDIQAMRP